MASPSNAFNIARRVAAGRTWEPFHGGAEYSGAAAIAKLTGAIMTGGRRRALMDAATASQDMDRRYRDLQIQLLERRLATPEQQPDPTYEMDLPNPGALAPGEIGPQVANPATHVAGLTGNQVVLERARQDAAAAAAANTAHDNMIADERLRLAQRVAAEMRAAREKRGRRQPDAGPKAGRAIEQLTRQEQELLDQKEYKIRNEIDIALADLNRPDALKLRKPGSAEAFLGLNKRDLQYPELVKDVVESVVRRYMTRRRLEASRHFGPMREKYRETTLREADAAAGDDSFDRLDAAVEALTQGR